MEIDVLEPEKMAENDLDSALANTTETETLADGFEWIKKEVLVLIVKAGKYANFDLCGKKMVDYVSMATSICTQVVLEREEEIEGALLKLGKDYNFVAVLYSDTPLLQKATFYEIMKYCSWKKMKYLPLKRGFVISGDYVENYRDVMVNVPMEFGTDDFTIIDNASMISVAFKKLNRRIINFHKSQGVVLIGEETIFIDADVEIGEGTVIYPNNVLKGESYIGKNVTIESGNYIADTIVLDNSMIVQSYLEKSKISENKVVGPFQKLINEML